MGEIVPLEQQGFVPALCECVGEAVAEVELRRVAAAPAEVPVRCPGHLHLLGRDRLQDESGLGHEIVDLSTGDRIAA